jgi:hypothetical protein
LRQGRGLGAGQATLRRQDEEFAVEVGRNVQCTDQLAPDVVEGIVVEVETSLYPAIGDAALGDEPPEDLFQDLLKVLASALVRRNLRRSLVRWINLSRHGRLVKRERPELALWSATTKQTGNARNPPF